MDLFIILFLSGVSIIFGVILTLVLQYYVILRYFNNNPIANAPKKFNIQEYDLPEAIKKELENEDYSEKSENSSLPVSLMLQFLFHELRHSEAIKKWLYKKLSLEFDELLTKTTIGKFFDEVSIRDMHLGTQFPDIKGVKVESIKLDKTSGHIETLNLCINLEYSGNFLLSVDGKMKFGKTAYLSIKVKYISGYARLQFTRIPYTHWSFSFYNDPVMDLAVESHFQGRQLQSNITNLIVNQIKKAIKRKHTLPNYKIRYKPFFIKTDPGQTEFEDNEIVPQGQLELTCVEVTRLSASQDIVSVYCTVTLDSLPWICVQCKDGVYSSILELTISKVRQQQQLGVIFKQEAASVIVDVVTPQTPASRAGLKPGDVILAVENKPVVNVAQIGKIIKSSSAVNISLRVERVVNNYVLKLKDFEKTDYKTPIVSTSGNVDVDADTITITAQSEQDNFVMVDNVKADADFADAKKNKPISNAEKAKVTDKVPKLLTGNENVSKFAQTIGNFTLRKRKASAERASNDGSNKSTPTPSIPGTPQHAPKHTISIPNLLMAKKHSISEIPEIIRTSSEGVDAEILSTPIDVFRGREIPISSLVSFNDEYVFTLKDGLKYLNINVWGTTPNTKDTLLGYINIPLGEILNECCNSMLGHYIRSYSFLPPNTAPVTSNSHPLMSHSGFEHVFCYGDILVSFLWNHDDVLELKNKEETRSDLDAESDPKPLIVNKHDFVRTQFHRTTHCDFCSKKIWLKDAVQCRECSLCCHKKCISKCQISTECIPADRQSNKSDLQDLQPDILLTELADDAAAEPECKQGLSFLKRVNSANNLAIPGSQSSQNQSKSLPPSPQRTPSRKQSLVNGNPFIMCPHALDEISKQQEATDIVNKLLESVISYSTDESLMDVAKETGKQLYASISYEDKVEKINVMMTELKKIFDVVTDEHATLTRQMNGETSEVEKAKLAFLIGQADSKMHGLSVLMLHFCSGLQHTQEKIV